MKPAAKKYRFTLDRKAIAVLACGLLLSGVLVFADGIFIGMGMYRKSVLPILLAAQKGPTPSAAAPLAVAHNAPPPAAPAASPQAATVPAATPAATPAALAVAMPDSACGTAPAAAPAAGSAAFALQLGSFEDVGNATRLAADLKVHGCTAVVSQITDASHRVWNVVRVGPYDSLEEAAAAAAAMRRTQGLLALVRPLSAI